MAGAVQTNKNRTAAAQATEKPEVIGKPVAKNGEWYQKVKGIPGHGDLLVPIGENAGPKVTNKNGKPVIEAITPDGKSVDLAVTPKAPDPAQTARPIPEKERAGNPIVQNGGLYQPVNTPQGLLYIPVTKDIKPITTVVAGEEKIEALKENGEKILVPARPPERDAKPRNPTTPAAVQKQSLNVPPKTTPQVNTAPAGQPSTSGNSLLQAVGRSLFSSLLPSKPAAAPNKPIEPGQQRGPQTEPGGQASPKPKSTPTQGPTPPQSPLGNPVLRNDRWYVAVQGPPGKGTVYVPIGTDGMPQVTKKNGREYIEALTAAGEILELPSRPPESQSKARQPQQQTPPLNQQGLPQRSSSMQQQPILPGARVHHTPSLSFPRAPSPSQQAAQPLPPMPGMPFLGNPEMGPPPGIGPTPSGFGPHMGPPPGMGPGPFGFGPGMGPPPAMQDRPQSLPPDMPPLPGFNPFGPPRR